jgi:hypothetical protein
MTPGPAGTVLRLELRGTDGPGRDGAAQTYAVQTHTVQTYTVRADRLTVEDGRLSLWRGAELVFQCPAAALAAIAFESPADPPAHPHPGPYSGPYPDPHPDHHQKPHDPLRDAHHDLASANTRWTAEDEHRLRELHLAGIPLDAIARTLGRQRGAVRARLARLRASAGTATDENAEA